MRPEPGTYWKAELNGMSITYYLNDGRTVTMQAFS